MDKNKPNQPTFIESLISTNPDWFEQILLGCIMLDPDFRNQVVRVLGVDPVSGAELNEFTLDVDNAIYKAYKTFLMCVHNARGAVFTLEFAHVILDQMANKNDGIGQSEIQDALERLNRMLQTRVADTLGLVKDGFQFWLKKQRMTRVVNTHNSRQSWNPDDMAREMRLNTQAVELTSGRPTFFGFGNSLDNHVLEIVRVPLTMLKALTKSLGGGFGKKESTLIIAPQGAGKTVASCQFGSDLAAYSKQTGLIITTEQGHEELEPRVISANCNIPFEKIKDSFNEKLLSPMEREAYHAFRQKIDGRLFWENWNEGDHGRSIESDLMELIERRQDEIGRKLDFIILDWIGGALGKLTSGDSDKLRFILQLAGNTIAQVAKDLDIFTIAFAQAGMGVAINKPRVDSTTIANCKSLGEKFTNIMGITAMFTENVDVTEENAAAFDQKQSFYISKGRKSVGGFVKVRRDFGFQRFQDLFTTGRS